MARTTTRCVDHTQWNCTKFLMPIDKCNATISTIPNPNIFPRQYSTRIDNTRNYKTQSSKALKGSPNRPKMPLMERTTTVRADHTHWKCVRPERNGGYCNTTMAMLENQCRKCAAIREPRFAYAMTREGHKLGVLGSVDIDNIEMWHYELET
ncbi:hypothetical protein FOXG_01318 [Fusarium oxysporum f. sp. lycopersici 4287]|uniref:Uncharacterized protein n=2 Tax=Fusarium oxysporum TaxID=5507 RepID=A0A0J9WH05_FUSO4|nr:hypothetical protein FOXG_01318 [Fusarium oxysporum f. sp. lycopersici 4287]KNA95941.1 hypothetical protein FOXG_01318 [Fusarium oxysporum f. sp. lycopersici 4287]